MTSEYTSAADLPARKGTWAWVLVLGTLLFPVIAPLVFAVAAVFAYHFYNKQRDVGAVNARNAANWIVTYAAVSLGCAIAVFIVGAFAYLAPLPLGVLAWILVGAWALTTLLTIAYAIMGIVAAAHRRSFETAYTWHVIKGDRVWEGQ